jgi:DNA-binding response OmpR family regulator
MKLLIVDSDHHLVEMLTGWLKTLGYDVRRAYTGERAKREWLEQHPDLVILDAAACQPLGIRPLHSTASHSTTVALA